MLDGSRWRTTMVLFALLLAGVPAVEAAPPAPNLESAFSLGGQDLSDLAMDPTGEYVVAVVPVDATGKLLPRLPGAPVKNDIYPCDFGAPGSRSSGIGCRSPGINNKDAQDTRLTSAQMVDATSFGASVAMRYVVGGPSDSVSLWSSIDDNAAWTRVVPGGQAVVNVTIAPDASRVVAATAPTAGGTGRIHVYNGTGTGQTAGALAWSWDLPEGRPTALKYARTTGLAVVGATDDVYFVKPGMTRAPQPGEFGARDLDAAVSDVAISRDAAFAVVGTSGSVYFITLSAEGKPVDGKTWSRGVPAQRVALSLDGERFAVASGSKIHFYRNTRDTFVAEAFGDPYDAGAYVTDLAYDASARLLVAIAGNTVYGFGPQKNAPIWSFDATRPANGGVDGPLRRVVVSDGAERVVVGGKTTIMPYRTLVSASAAFVQVQKLEVKPGTTQKLSFVLTNTGSLTDNYTFVTRFPIGWTGQPPQPVTLRPEESATVNLSVDVPAGQPPGFHSVDIEVRSQILQNAGAEKPIVAGPALNLTVPRAVILNLTTAEERHPALKQGGEHPVPVTIRNIGNAEGVVNLSLEQALTRGASWVVKWEKDQVIVPAGGERTLNVIINAPQDAASGDRNDITVIAREGTTSEAKKTIVIYVDPKWGAQLTSPNATYEFGPGEIRTVKVRITNTGNTADSFNLTSTVSPASIASDWNVVLQHPNVNISRGGSLDIAVSVKATVAEPSDASLIIKAISLGSAETETGSINLALVAKPPVTTTPDNFIPGATPALVLLVLALVAARRAGGRAR